jgi:hypothetical protein
VPIASNTIECPQNFELAQQIEFSQVDINAGCLVGEHLLFKWEDPFGWSTCQAIRHTNDPHHLKNTVVKDADGVLYSIFFDVNKYTNSADAETSSWCLLAEMVVPPEGYVLVKQSKFVPTEEEMRNGAMLGCTGMFKFQQGWFPFTVTEFHPKKILKYVFECSDGEKKTVMFAISKYSYRSKAGVSSWCITTKNTTLNSCA